MFDGHVKENILRDGVYTNLQRDGLYINTNLIEVHVKCIIILIVLKHYYG